MMNSRWVYQEVKKAAGDLFALIIVASPSGSSPRLFMKLVMLRNNESGLGNGSASVS